MQKNSLLLIQVTSYIGSYWLMLLFASVLVSKYTISWVQIYCYNQKKNVERELKKNRSS